MNISLNTNVDVPILWSITGPNSDAHMRCGVLLRDLFLYFFFLI